MFQAELKSRQKHYQVRRTHSDLGGQRLLQWDPRATYRRLMSTPTRTRPRSPQRKPPDVPTDVAGAGGVVQLRGLPRCGQLRRSLSQPLDIDKLSPLMRTKTAGNVVCFTFSYSFFFFKNIILLEFISKSS